MGTGKTAVKKAARQFDGFMQKLNNYNVPEEIRDSLKKFQATLNRLDSFVTDENELKLQSILDGLAKAKFDDVGQAIEKASTDISEFVKDMKNVKEEMLPKIKETIDNLDKFTGLLASLTQVNLNPLRFINEHPYKTALGIYILSSIAYQQNWDKTAKTMFTIGTAVWVNELVKQFCLERSNYSTSELDEKLLLAAKSQDEKEVYYLLSRGATLSAKDKSGWGSDGWNALHWAVWYGNTDIVSCIVASEQCRKQINDTTSSTKHGGFFSQGAKHTPLHILKNATYKLSQKDEILDLLLKAGADEKMKDLDGNDACGIVPKPK